MSLNSWGYTGIILLLKLVYFDLFNKDLPGLLLVAVMDFVHHEYGWFLSIQSSVKGREDDSLGCVGSDRAPTNSSQIYRFQSAIIWCVTLYFDFVHLFRSF